MSLRSFILLGAATVGLSASLVLGPLLWNDADPVNARTGRFLPKRMLDPFPAITEFPTLPASGADGWIDPLETVLGVEINGQPRAYPIDMIQYVNKEILDDSLGGVPVAVTWCDLCQSALVFDRRVAGRTLTFRVAGMIWRNNMVMQDLETGTLWSQLTGEAVEGELAGSRLEPFPSILTTWMAWNASHPDGTVLHLERDPLNELPADQITSHADRFPTALADDFFLGVHQGDRSRGWTLEYLRQTPLVNDDFCGEPIVVHFDPENETATVHDRRVGGQTLTFRRADGKLVDLETESHWDPISGVAVSGPLKDSRLRPLASRISYGKSWRKFFPDGDVRAWSAKDGENREEEVL